jgi:hypothetical protein
LEERNIKEIKSKWMGEALQIKDRQGNVLFTGCYSWYQTNRTSTIFLALRQARLWNNLINRQKQRDLARQASKDLLNLE